MKRILPVILLATGFFVGWSSASIMAHRKIEKITQAFAPDLVKMMTELMKGMTRAEMEQMSKNARDYSCHFENEDAMRALWQAVLATQIQAALAKGDTSRVHERLTAAMARLEKAHAEGHFKGSEWEKLADNLASQIKETNGLPTTRRTASTEPAPSIVK